MKNVLERLQQLSNVPEIGADEFDKWRQHNNAMKFLHENTEDDWLVIYSEMKNVFIHGVLVPERELKPLNTDDLLKWQGNPYSSWCVGDADSDVPIRPPLASFRSETLAKGEQIIFIRSPGEDFGIQKYVEINQKITHSLKLHYRHDQKAWFKPDKNGDLKPLIKIIEEDSGFIVAFDRDLLSAYAALTESILVRMFDFPAYHEAGKFPHVYYRVSRGYFSEYYRGIQLLKSAMSKIAAVEMIDIGYDIEQEYETFRSLDWHNQRLVNMSCSMEVYKLLPAFFRQEVLSKYKFDQNKYNFSEYSVGKGSQWKLMYSINDEGQVHAWLVDIGKIPYDEQKHWKLYNEEPLPKITDFEQEPEQILKGVFNEGFFDAQIKGSWDYPLSSLSALKETLHDLHESNCLWWKTDPRDRISQINYPIVKSLNDCADWEREILALNRLVIEGLQGDWLESKIKELEQDVEGVKGTLNLLEKYLMALGHKDISEVIFPLRELKKLRNRVSPAHEQLKEKDKLEAKELKAKVLEKHGSYWKHYDCLVGKCNETLQKLAEMFGNKIQKEINNRSHQP